jgi:hypothetical protein
MEAVTRGVRLTGPWKSSLMVVDILGVVLGIYRTLSVFVYFLWYSGRPTSPDVIDL